MFTGLVLSKPHVITNARLAEEKETLGLHYPGKNNLLTAKKVTTNWTNPCEDKLLIPSPFRACSLQFSDD